CCSVRWEATFAGPGTSWCWIAGSPPLPDTVTDPAANVSAGTHVPGLGRAPRILFVPVSGTYGMGEYARSLAIARAASRRWQGAAIQFVLSRAAPYPARAPFPTPLL